MRRLLIPVLALFFLSACSTYQYCTLNAPGLSGNDAHKLVWGNDTLELTYDFHGQNGPITLTILNKKDKPLYINWKKSDFIRNGHAFSLSKSNDVASGNTAAGYGQLIPPSSYITKFVGVDAQLAGFDQTFFSDTAKTTTGKNSQGLSYKYKDYTYDANQSPLKLTSYLTFATGPDNALQEFSISHTFFINHIKLSKSQPIYQTSYWQDGDKFYLIQ